MGRGTGLSSPLRASPTQYLHTVASLEPLEFYGGFITSAWLTALLVIDNWFNLQPLALLQRSGGWYWKPQCSNHMVRSPGNHPCSQVRSWSHLINLSKRYLEGAHHLRCPQGCGELRGGNCRQKPNIYEKYLLVTWKTKYNFFNKTIFSHFFSI